MCNIKQIKTAKTANITISAIFLIKYYFIGDFLLLYIKSINSFIRISSSSETSFGSFKNFFPL